MRTDVLRWSAGGARPAGWSLAVLAWMLIGCAGAPGDRSRETRPNIVVILADDQGWGDLSGNGNTNLSTPHIDRIAERGVRFDRFYVSPVCSPTRAEWLTGRYHPRGGVYDTSSGGERLDLDETTIADVFRRAGYATAAFGKWHNGTQPPYHPNARGFDEYYGFTSGHWGDYFSPMLDHNGEIVQGNGYLVDDLTDHALSFVEAHTDRPFFVYLALNTPHSPMQVPDRWWDAFASRELGLRHRDPDLEDVAFTRAALAMCENIDWNVGRITDRLEALGLDERTIVIYFSDNGPNSWRWNGGMKGRKGSTDEGGVRSPFLIQWPGILGSGRTVGEIAGAIDLLPTLTDLAGIPAETNHPVDGVSLKPLLLNPSAPWEDRFIFSHWSGRTSVRNRRYRLDTDGGLFDMMSDPGQATDVSESFADVARRLRDAKAAWERTVLAELPEQDSRPFPVGHPDFVSTQLPARDATFSGAIRRSNRWPNCSFLTDWTSPEDRISWDVDVLAPGRFEVILYYTCAPADAGATIEVSFGGATRTATISEAHDPPLRGMQNDRVERGESYVKDFTAVSLGQIELSQGRGALSLRAVEIPGAHVVDFRMLVLKRLDRPGG